MPISSAAWRLLATARTALPGRVWYMKPYSAPAMTMARTAATIWVPGMV